MFLFLQEATFAKVEYHVSVINMQSFFFSRLFDRFTHPLICNTVTPELLFWFRSVPVSESAVGKHSWISICIF